MERNQESRVAKILGSFKGMCWSLLALSVAACSQQNEPANIFIQLPEATPFQQSSLSPTKNDLQILSEPAWEYDGLQNFDEVFCYALLLGAPDHKGTHCKDENDQVIADVGSIWGTYPAGGTIEVSTQSGKNRSLYLVGLRASSLATCSSFKFDGTTKTGFSRPHILSQKVLDIVPGDNLITLTAQVSGAPTFEKCAKAQSGVLPVAPPAPEALLEAQISLEFLTIPVSNMSTAQFTVTNAGDATAAAVAAATLTPPFGFTGGSYPGTNGTCSGVLPVGASCVLELSFHPAAVDSYSDTLILTYSTGGQSKSLSVGLSGEALPPADLQVQNAPLAFSNETLLNVTVGGTSIEAYKYKVGGAGTLCSDETGYSAETSVATLITDDISSLADGTITLCVVGKDSWDIWTDYTSAVSHTWTKDTVPPGGPQVTINAGDSFTQDQNVTLSLMAVDASKMYVTGTAGCSAGGTWEMMNSSRSWTLSQTNAAATVYAMFRDSAGNETSCVSASILHDNLPPAAPTGLSFGVVPPHPDYSPTLSFVGAVDVGPAGVSDHHVQFYLTSDDSILQSWQPFVSGYSVPLGLTPGLSYYAKVRAVDSAGNLGAESGPLSWVARDLRATAMGIPQDYSADEALDVMVGGMDIDSYRFKLGPRDTTDCSMPAGYSSDLPVSSPIDASLDGLSGDLVLCLTGGNGEAWQEFIHATQMEWIQRVALVLRVQIPNDGDSATLPLKGVADQIMIDWGDGVVEPADGSVTPIPDHNHMYAVAGTYTIRVYGKRLTSFGAPGYPNSDKIVEVVSFGDIGITSLGSAFHSAVNLVALPEHLPPSVTNLQAMFKDNTTFNLDISSWEVGQVYDMSNMFNGASQFNQDLSGWNTSTVIYMNHMFSGASSFNQDISGWQTTSVVNMSNMFSGASSFNKNIGSWDITNVTSMAFMFQNASAFNQDIRGWYVEDVANMAYMFNGASAFTYDLSGWVVENVSACSGFANGASFPAPIFSGCTP